jgi:hypothetical protein
MFGQGERTTLKLLRNLVRWQPFSESQRETIRVWTLLSKTRTFLAELLCFAEREWRSKRYSTTSRAGKRSKTFWRDFLPSRVNRQLLRSKKRNTCCWHAPKRKQPNLTSSFRWIKVSNISRI